MKVGIYFPGFPQESGGGYTFEQEILLSLCNLAQHCHHELVFFFENTQGLILPPIIAEKGFKTILIESPNKFQLISSKIIRKLNFMAQSEAPNPFRMAVEREKVELIWFTTSIYVPVDIPYIATVWDIQHRLQPWFPEVSRDGMWENRETYYSAYLKRAAYIITPNCAGRDELALFYQIPPERFRLLPHPTPNIERLPTENEVKCVLEKYRLPGDYLFYPAQFWAHKNHVNLLLALSSLNKSLGHKKNLVLVGSDQGNLEYIRECSRYLDLEEQVHFLGFIPREDLTALYSGAFALTFVSLFGPENLPPLEAFKIGCPVIAANVSGAQEQYGDAALLVDGLAPEEIARAVIRLEREASLRQMLIKKGRKRAEVYGGMEYVRDVFKIFDDFERVRRNWGVT
jgi:glycosyltransferase involved in cell wall biosynthesis